MSETHHTFCRICESLCGLEVTVDEGRITKVRPDEQHVATRGFACIKGIKQSKLYDSPDRLTQPLALRNGQHVEVSWDEALAGIGAKVKQLRGDHGPDSIGMYVGTAAGFSMLHPLFAQGFMTGLGSKSIFASATQDCANKFAVARLMYGFPFIQPFPDHANTRCLIIVGANPIVSKWSFLQVPNPFVHLKEAEKRGAQIYVVDPRRTETAKAAGEHIFIRPDTDVFFYLGFLHALIELGGVSREAVEAHTTGWPEIEALVAPWTPERCGEVTRIEPRTLRRLVSAFIEADGAALYSSTGVNMGRDGTLAFWLQEVIHAVSGNLDRRGGTLVPQGIFDFPAFGVKNGVGMRTDRSRIGGLPSVNDAVSGQVLADEILTPGEGQIRAMFITGGNPLITMPNSNRLKKAFEQLELLVTLDIYRNETGSLAHYVLPATSPFQRPDLPFIFPLWLGLQSKPYLQATRAVVPPEGGQRDEATIYHDLCRACGVGLFGSKVVTSAMELARKGRWITGSGDGLPQEGMLDLMLRITRQPSFASLMKAPHGVPRPDHTWGDFVPERIQTDDKRVHLAPEPLMTATARLQTRWQQELDRADSLKLITKRALTTHNSWTHNLEDFVKEERGNHTNHLYMHSTDADARGVVEGDMVDVRTATGTVRLPVSLLDDLMPGVVALPHGWGHQHAKGLSVASKTAGVNVNLLAADGPNNADPVSGMAHLTGFPVEVYKAEGPQERGSWSGMAEG